MHRTHRTPRRGLLLATLAVLALAGLLWRGPIAAQERPAEVIPAPSTLVYLVRHGEKGSGDAYNPELSDEGVRRAMALARALRDVPVTHLFVTEYQRTHLTLQPLSEATGIELTQVAASDVEAQVEALQALPTGSVAVVAGHSNTVPAMVRALGGRAFNEGEDGPERNLGHDEYDRLYAVVLPPPGEARMLVEVTTLHLRFGE